MNEMNENLEQLKAEYDKALSEVQMFVSRNCDQGTIDNARRKALALGGRVAAAMAEQERSTSRRNFGIAYEDATSGLARGRRAARTLGGQFAMSETFQWLQKHKGRFPTGQWASPSSELGGFSEFNATLTSDSASGGDLVIADHREGILPLPLRPLVVADLLAPGTTNSNAVQYMKEVTATNAATPVAEGAAAPESTLVFDAVTDPVRKISTWLPVTEEMLDDVSALHGYIDNRLRSFVQLAEDDQLLNGNGTAPNLEGILSRSGLAADQARGSDTNADAILKQIRAIETATNLPVDGVVLHPTNWDTLLLLKDSTGQYIAGGGPFAAPQRKTLWGRDVALTTAITLNTALVGAFKSAGQFFRRGGLRVEATNAHADFFVKGLVAIRAESRGALAVYRPSAFGKVTGLN